MTEELKPCWMCENLGKSVWKMTIGPTQNLCQMHLNKYLKIKKGHDDYFTENITIDQRFRFEQEIEKLRSELELARKVVEEAETFVNNAEVESSNPEDAAITDVLTYYHIKKAITAYRESTNDKESNQ